MYWLLSGSLATSVVVWSDYSLLIFYTFYVISSALVTSAFPSLSTAGLYVLSHFSCVQLSVTLWAVAHQGPLSTGFSRQEYWSGLPCPPPEDLPNPEIKLRSPELQVDSLPSEPPGNCQIQKTKTKTKTIYWTVFQQLPSGIQSKDFHK